MNSPTQVSGSPLPRKLVSPSESVFGGEGLGVRGFRLAAARFFIIAAMFIHGMLTCPITLGQEPGVEQQAVEPDAKKPSIEFLKPLINVELSFIKRVCDLTDDQMKPIVAAAKEAHQAMAGIVMKRDTAGDDFFTINKVVFSGPNGELMVVNPYKRIRDDVAEFLKPLVTAEQHSKFVEETRLRDAYERETAIAFVLNLLDSRLALSMHQREQMHKKLMTDWKYIDLHWLDCYVMPTSSFPPAPDQLITPILSGSQRKLFESQQRELMLIHVHIDDEDPLRFNEQWLDQ